jgi:hypothetical protein
MGKPQKYISAFVLLCAACFCNSCGSKKSLDTSSSTSQQVSLQPGELKELYLHEEASKVQSKSSALFEPIAAEESGIDFVNLVDNEHPMSRLYILGYACGGISIGDIDGDGWDDIYCTGGPRGSVLYKQVGKLKFEDITSKSGVSAKGHWSVSSQFVDVDNDGDLDIYVCNYDTPNLLYINDGKGVFTESAKDSGTDVKDASLSAHFADYDNDGDLDYYLITNRLIRAGGLPTAKEATYATADGKPALRPEFKQYYEIYEKADGKYTIKTIGRPDRLFENDGNGKFRDVTREAGIEDRAYGLSATWFDYDGDGLIDIYVANDFQDPDYFYRNNGDGSFTNVIKSAVPHTTWFSMGSDVADLNNDGLLDLFVLDMAATTHYQAKIAMGDMSAFKDFMDTSVPRQMMRNALFIHSGTSRFLESAWLSGLAASGWSWAAKLSDFDNDGFTDVFVSNGMSANIRNPDQNFRVVVNGKQKTIPYSQSLLNGREEWQLWYKSGLQKDTNQAFQNLGHLKFKDVSKDWGLDHLGASYSAATGDLDRDGDLDLVVASLDEPVKIFRNDSARNRITISLRGNESNRYGIGAIIRADSGKDKQTKIMNPMTGYASCNGPVIHFGIGDEDKIDRLEVEWPGGIKQSFKDLVAGSHYVVSQSKENSPPEQDKKGTGTGPMFAPIKSIQSEPHKETFFNDFALQPLLPNKLSHLGPGIAVGDTDGDGVDEIVLGSARSGPLAVHHNREGSISWKEISASSAHNSSEDMSPLLFDADSDGDADLFVVSGGVESGPEELRDRLYLNDGNGAYEHAPDGTLPDLMISGSVASAADFDRDGDLDIFVGGRLHPGKYPTGPKSTLLLNETVKGEKVLFTDGTKRLCPEIENCGMVTSALWSDANGDGWVDLLLSIEWGPVRIFINNEGKLKETTQDSGLKEYSGWWNGLAGRDLDGDGDIDYVATNFGLNTKYHPSKKKPSRIYYGAFGESSLPRIVEAKVAEDCILPVRGKSCSQNAMPFVREKFNTYHKFASATLTDIYTQTALQQSESFEVNYLKSVVFINDGNANFKAVPLPELSQIAPGFGVIATEVNGDGKADIYLTQNFYHPQRETGKMAGGMSVLLLGDGSGSFNEVWPNRSGLTVPEDARGLSSCDLNDDGWVDFAVGINDGKMKLFENKISSDSENKSFMIRLSDGPGNPTGVGARVRVELTDGSTQTDEVRAGGSYLSQSSSGLFFGISSGNKVRNIKVRWPDGEETAHQYSSVKHKVIITRTAQ